MKKFNILLELEAMEENVEEHLVTEYITKILHNNTDCIVRKSTCIPTTKQEKIFSEEVLDFAYNFSQELNNAGHISQNTKNIISNFLAQVAMAKFMSTTGGKTLITETMQASAQIAEETFRK